MSFRRFEIVTGSSAFEVHSMREDVSDVILCLECPYFSRAKLMMMMEIF
jgi:hypothetical protein